MWLLPIPGLIELATVLEVGALDSGFGVRPRSISGKLGIVGWRCVTDIV